MLKHVSYRASSTSLSRPFGSCRISSTLPPQSEDANSCSSSDCSSSSLVVHASAPNSPQIPSYPRHVRHHSITPSSDQYIPPGDASQVITRKGPSSLIYSNYRNTYAGDSPKSFTHQSAIRQAGNTRANDEDSPHSSNDSVATLRQTNYEDNISLKADDPLSRHRSELRSMDSITMRELMPELPPSDSSDSISLHSAISLSTLCRNDLRASTTSLCNSSGASKVSVNQPLGTSSHCCWDVTVNKVVIILGVKDCTAVTQPIVPIILNNKKSIKMITISSLEKRFDKEKFHHDTENIICFKAPML